MVFALSAVLAAAPRTRHIVHHDAVTIEVIAEGRGPLVALLPSLGRDSEEFDSVAERIGPPPDFAFCARSRAVMGAAPAPCKYHPARFCVARRAAWARFTTPAIRSGSGYSLAPNRKMVATDCQPLYASSYRLAMGCRELF